MVRWIRNILTIKQFVECYLHPTAGEIANGSLTLTLTSTGNGSCSSVTDQVTIFFTAAPTVDAGANQISCANNPDVTLNASFTIASGIVWSGGSGTFSPSNTSPNAVYTPSATEITMGTVTLTATTTGNGTCNQVLDQVTITIQPAPVVNAGQDISSCANNSSVSLSGQVFNATGGMWSGGSGTFRQTQIRSMLFTILHLLKFLTEALYSL
ncbi:MAG: hypothetical protein R2809_15010 [Flavobacteriales bacterium]